MWKLRQVLSGDVVGILIAPNGFLPIRQAPRPKGHKNISPEAEISLGNAISGDRSELQRQVLITDDHAQLYDIPHEAFAWLHRVSMSEARVKSPGTKKRLEGQRYLLNVPQISPCPL